MLGQVRTGERSDEISAIPELREALRLRGALVTVDAMGYLRNIAQRILDGGAHYVLKDSRSTLLTAMDADVIKTYVALDVGVGIIASMAYDGRKDDNLVCIGADHLFEPNTTRVAVRRGAYLRGYAHDFIGMFAPHLSRETVAEAVASSVASNGGRLYQEQVAA